MVFMAVSAEQVCDVLLIESRVVNERSGGSQSGLSHPQHAEMSTRHRTSDDHAAYRCVTASVDVW